MSLLQPVESADLIRRAADSRLERHSGCFGAARVRRARRAKHKARRGAGSASGRSGFRLVGAVHTREVLARQSTHALSGDTASKSPVFSTREAGPWTNPSSSAPSAGQCTGRGQTRCAEAADIIQVGAPSVAQVEVRPVSSQTVPWLDSRGCWTTYPVRGIGFGGAAGVMRGGLGSNGAWANNLEEAAHEAASCDAARLAQRELELQHWDMAQPAELAASLGPSKFRPHVPLCLRHPDFIFPGTCRMDEEVCKS